MNCSVCLSRIDQPASIDCGHVYHYGCIDRWTTLNPVCPECKQAVTHINSQYATKNVSAPKVGFDTLIAGYLYGPIRRHVVPVPYDQQPDLPGFVVHATSDEILAREGQVANGREEVAMCRHLSHSDLRPVYTRTRSRGSKHVT